MAISTVPGTFSFCEMPWPFKQGMNRSFSSSEWSCSKPHRRKKKKLVSTYRAPIKYQIRMQLAMSFPFTDSSERRACSDPGCAPKPRAYRLVAKRTLNSPAKRIYSLFGRCGSFYAASQPFFVCCGCDRDGRTPNQESRSFFSSFSRVW